MRCANTLLQWRWYTALCCYDFASSCVYGPDGVLLALGEQRVRWYWCMLLTIAAVSAWCSMDTLSIIYSIAIGYSCTLYEYTTTMMAPDWFWFLLNIVSCWLWTSRKYVSIGACFSWKQSVTVYLVFDILITIAHSCDVEFNYNDGYGTRLCIDCDFGWTHDGTVSCSFWSSRGYVGILVYVWIWRWHYLIPERCAIRP